MNEPMKCVGCGVQIQTEDRTRPGYTPSSAMTRDPVICQRCFRLKHYNDIQDVSLSNDDFFKILHRIGSQKALIVKIVDIFDFNGSWLPGIHRFAGSNEVVLVGNKVDLLPKSVNRNRLLHWMWTSSNELGLKPASVHLISAEKGWGIDQVISDIKRRRTGHDVYVIGCTNVGKSTFINRIIKAYGARDAAQITTSRFPGTTLDLIEIPLDDGRTLYDTPGIINPHQMAHFVDKEELKTIMPKKEIKPKIYQLNERQTLFFGGLARLDYISGERLSFVCYFSNDLNIHRTKLENADDLYESQKGELLIPPKRENKEAYPPLKKHQFHFRGKKTDLVFSGLGWVAVNAERADVIAYVPEGVRVSLRKALI